MFRNMISKIIPLMLMIIFVLSFAGCDIKVPFGTQKTQPAQVSSRLFDDHNAFIAKVKDNLGVPNSTGITYTVGTPAFQSVINAETVYVSFTENNQTVAAAECLTENGDLSRSIQMYSTPSQNPGSIQSPVPSSQPSQPTQPSQPPVTSQNPYSNVSYNSYTNARYGYTVYYPDFLTPQPEPTNGDGRKFISADGSVVMSAWGSKNPMISQQASTLDGLYAETLSNCSYSVTYKTKDKNNSFFVISGYSGNNIVYEKHILKSDLTENVFVIEYPASLKKEFDSIVTYISKSMSTGIGYDSESAK